MAARAEDAAASAEAPLSPPEGGGAPAQPAHNSITANAKSVLGFLQNPAGADLPSVAEALFIADILPPSNLIDS
jgi:hypothetical protein